MTTTSVIDSISTDSKQNLLSISKSNPRRPDPPSEALEMILSPDCPDDVDLEDENFMDTYQEASDLYGLIHARFIISPRGTNLNSTT